MTHVMPDARTLHPLGPRASLVPLALVLSFLAFLGRLTVAGTDLSPFARLVVLTAPLIALLASVAITGRLSAVALCALAPAALLYPLDDYFLGNVGSVLTGMFAFAFSHSAAELAAELRSSDLPWMLYMTCMLVTAILPPVAAALAEKGRRPRSTRILFALSVAAYLPLLVAVEPDAWRSVGRGAFAVAGGPVFRLAALLALGWMAVFQRRSPIEAIGSPNSAEP